MAPMYLKWSTVVPALGDPRRERPPAVYGHFVNVPTHVNVRLPLISGQLPNRPVKNDDDPDILNNSNFFV